MSAIEEREVSLTPASDLLPRSTSRDLAQFPLPNGREEVWRFTPLTAFARVLADEATVAPLSWTATMPEGVSLEEVPVGDPALADLPYPVDRPAALAQAHARHALRLSVPAEAELAEPVVVRLTGNGDLAHGQLVVELGAHARATVVLQHEGVADYVEHTSVLVGDGAALELVHVQTWQDAAVHAGQVAIRLGRDARIRSTQVSLGGAAIRLVETVEYAGPGGDAELIGVYFADAGQHIEHRLFVDHAVPSCRSNVLYKGALQGESAHTVWVGDVLIRAAATGTDTYELNRNLVLTEGARADSVPNLEIETGQIEGAGHASATGRFDDEQLFYLMSRGVPQDVARRLVVRGFFADVIERIGVPSVEAQLLAAVDAELGEIDPTYDFTDLDALEAGLEAIGAGAGEHRA
ncbi:MAG: Fe-S cluster assembly protein SufD [Candidatus Nanopelagicales bacterium]|nr:Fe-S cluster assembly protein SufD [Candidatus Nanopelagicales bacterium]